MSRRLSRDEAVAALRAAADLIEKLDEDHWWSAARLPGRWEKGTAGTNDSMFMLSQGIVELKGNRNEVCVARPTGNKVKQQKVVTPAVYEEVEVDEVEWHCEPLLARAAQ